MCYSVLVEQDLKRLSFSYHATIDVDAFANFEALQQRNPKKYKPLADRIYPQYFSPIIVADESERLIRPMRYRVRPHNSRDEAPSKYNLFNARLDSLETRKTWSGLFMRQHGILMAKGFFEWVLHEGKKRVILFKPKEHDYMVIPVIYDSWMAADGSEAFESFAVITGEPPPEVTEAGHDRCPLFLKEAAIEPWLNPSQESRAAIKKILHEREPTFYEHSLAAP